VLHKGNSLPVPPTGVLVAGEAWSAGICGLRGAMAGWVVVERILWAKVAGLLGGGGPPSALFGCDNKEWRRPEPSCREKLVAGPEKALAATKSGGAT
jgi:hypothetical protein